jgi:hypothetical protein
MTRHPINNKFFFRILYFICCYGCFLTSIYAQEKRPVMDIDWNKVIGVSKTTTTLQLVENPMVRPGSAIHRQTFAALKALGADYVRYVPWFPYPKLAVAELKAPTKDSTFWDFTYLDSTMAAFISATIGHSVVINFSTTPAWMWKTDSIVNFPKNPYQIDWDYNQGSYLRDTTYQELAGYFVRLFSWYTKGGFTDELGKFHKSGHFYNIPYWEVLNEPDLEHNVPIEMYTRIYDVIVKSLKQVAPGTIFIGMSQAFATNPFYFEYFLNIKNHLPGVEPEGISYHFYATPSWDDQELSGYRYTFFEKADAFIDRVRFIENIRKRLAPNTFTTINEVGTILHSPEIFKPIDSNYWNLSGALFAYIFLELTRQCIDVVGESQLVGYPSQFPDVSMMDWESGRPNARYWVLWLIHQHFNSGDSLVETVFKKDGSRGLIAQSFITKKGKKILLINTGPTEISFVIPSLAQGGWITSVDTASGEAEPQTLSVADFGISLKPFAVAVIQLK